jgi:signal transduction histidine kinase
MQVDPAPVLPDDFSIAIFRIFQEMLSNVGRHARASHVAIHIQADARQICIAVKDDGCGALPAAFDAPNAYGVMGMRERARHLGGSLDIASQVGLGSLFTLRIQLNGR